MIMTRSLKGSIRPVVVLLFAVVLLLCAVGGDDDRSPSPSLPLRQSRGRMQTPSAATKSAAKSDSPPSGRTMTRSASCAASRGDSATAPSAARVLPR